MSIKIQFAQARLHNMLLYPCLLSGLEDITFRHKSEENLISQQLHAEVAVSDKSSYQSHNIVAQDRGVCVSL